VEKKPPISPVLAGLAVLTTLLTWCLIVLGGVVHGTGSSLACPDWPTCQGTLFPEMVGGVAIEHSHRLLASSVGFLTILLVIFSWRSGHRVLRNLCLFALGLVIFQGVLGGITVLLKLPPFVSIGHLATSMAFLALMVWNSGISVSGARRGFISIPENINKSTKGWVLAAMGLTYLQVVLGGVVRHLGAGLACRDIPFCQGSLWPQDAPLTAQLHMAHRFGAVLVTAVVLIAAIKVLRRGHQGMLRVFAGNLIFLVLIQVGIWTFVVSGLPVVSSDCTFGIGCLTLGQFDPTLFYVGGR
jgi:heme A synthase